MLKRSDKVDLAARSAPVYRSKIIGLVVDQEIARISRHRKAVAPVGLVSLAFTPSG